MRPQVIPADDPSVHQKLAVVRNASMRPQVIPADDLTLDGDQSVISLVLQ